MTLRARVALLTAAAVAILELAIVGSIYGVTSDRLHAQIERDLRSAATFLVPVVQATGDLPVRPAQDAEAPNIRRVISPDGRVLSARAPLDLPVSTAARDVAGGARGPLLETVTAGGSGFYVFTVPAGPARAVQVARSLATVREVLDQLLASALVFGTAGIVAAIVAGGAIATAALAPLRRLGRTVGRITETGDLAQRVRVAGRDELATFGRSFDTMLDRLDSMVSEVERARRAQRQLVADASHELRAPLATLRANVELLSLGSEAPVGDRESLIADTLAGIGELTTLVEQLVDLAREDQRVHERAPVRLDTLVLDEIDRIQRRHPAVEFVPRLEEATVSGDAEALGRAVANLLDNAGKWCPPGGTVRIDLRGGTLEVRDDGPGVDDADLPHIFERFYRGARTADRPGSGLGLAIVAQVLASHGGLVAARRDPAGGTVFTATFARETS